MTGLPKYDLDNVFAKILRGEIPSHRVYEDDHTVAFMDVMPQGVGHTLILPKTASRNLLDADCATLAHILPVVQKIAKAAKVAFAADGISVMQFLPDFKLSQNSSRFDARGYRPLMPIMAIALRP